MNINTYNPSYRYVNTIFAQVANADLPTQINALDAMMAGTANELAFCAATLKKEQETGKPFLSGRFSSLFNIFGWNPKTIALSAYNQDAGAANLLLKRDRYPLFKTIEDFATRYSNLVSVAYNNGAPKIPKIARFTPVALVCAAIAGISLAIRSSSTSQNA